MMQDFRHTDMTVYEDGMEMNIRVADYVYGLSSEIDSDYAMNIFILKAALRQLPDLLQRRIRLFLYMDLQRMRLQRWKEYRNWLCIIQFNQGLNSYVTC